MAGTTCRGLHSCTCCMTPLLGHWFHSHTMVLLSQGCGVTVRKKPMDWQTHTTAFAQGNDVYAKHLFLPVPRWSEWTVIHFDVPACGSWQVFIFLIYSNLGAHHEQPPQFLKHHTCTVYRKNISETDLDNDGWKIIYLFYISQCMHMAPYQYCTSIPSHFHMWDQHFFCETIFIYVNHICSYSRAMRIQILSVHIDLLAIYIKHTHMHTHVRTHIGLGPFQEANPALLSVVTFPFIFGMMYGDVPWMLRRGGHRCSWWNSRVVCFPWVTNQSSMVSLREAMLFDACWV